MIGSVGYSPKYHIPKTNFGATTAPIQPQNEDQKPAHPLVHRPERGFWDRNLSAILGITSIALVGIAISGRSKANKQMEELTGNVNKRLQKIERKIAGVEDIEPNINDFSDGKPPSSNFPDGLFPNKKKLDKSDGLLKHFVPDEFSPKGFDDVIGMAEEKKKLKRLVLNPLQSPEVKKTYNNDYGLSLPSGILLEGNPGNGKTFLVQALAKELGSELYMMNMSELGSKFIHETGGNIAKVLDSVKEKAKNSEKPVILFLDELDGMARARTGDAQSHELEELNTILQNINNLQNNNIILIGATNRKDLIDSAILRPGRFAEHIFVDNPSLVARESFLTKSLSKLPKGKDFLASKEDVSKVVDSMDGLSNAEIKHVIENSSRLAFEDNQSAITKKHLQQSVDEFKKSRAPKAHS